MTSTMRMWLHGSIRVRRRQPALHKEPLSFEYVPLSQRSYK